MTDFQEACALLQAQLGQDEVIALATGVDEQLTVRNVDGYYQEGYVYVVSHEASHKMKHIALHPKVAFCKSYDPTRSYYEGLLEAVGVGENLGHPKGHPMRDELRAVFSSFYDRHVNEADPQTCILGIRLEQAVVFDGKHKYMVDFGTQTARKLDCET